MPFEGTWLCFGIIRSPIIGQFGSRVYRWCLFAMLMLLSSRAEWIEVMAPVTVQR